MRTRLLLILSVLLWQQNVLSQLCPSTNMNIIKVTPALGSLGIDYYDAAYTVQHCTFIFTANANVYSNRIRYGRPIFSVITVPFKVRKKQDALPQLVSSSVKNAGLNIGVFNWKMDRYFANGTTSSHKVGFGFLVAPSGEELSPENTDGQIVTKTTQLFISTGLSATYTYNAISFALIPVGYDFATTTDGTKWAYNRKWWWGFGIGVDTKLFGL